VSRNTWHGSLLEKKNEEAKELERSDKTPESQSSQSSSVFFLRFGMVLCQIKYMVRTEYLV